MCLIAFAVAARPGLPLLLAANRDEFFERPTAPLHRWALPAGGEVLAGRDLRDGGTWLGVSLCGRVAMLTNVRGPEAAPGQRSRGELATRWLSGQRLDALKADIDPRAYGGFNLVVGDIHAGAWHWISNCDPRQPHAGVVARLAGRTLAPGVYGLSNAALDTPWPKALRLKAALNASLQTAELAPEPAQRAGWERELARALADGTTAPADALPATGIDPEREAGLSSAFVQLPDHAYGTRSSLALRIAAAPGAPGWRLDAHEWTHTPQAPHQPHRWDDSRRRSETLILLPG
jgi:uncharacterized protein with NRDE domain